MTANKQFQDQHLIEGSTDWVLKQRIERDICLLYKQLSECSYLMGDLYFGDVYALPYWDYFSFPGLGPVDEKFIRESCLVMVLTMAWEVIDGGGSYLHPYLAVCRQRTSALPVVDERTTKLCKAVELALTAAESGEAASPVLVELSSWAHSAIVRAYFRNVVHDFDNTPYFKNDGSSA